MRVYLCGPISGTTDYKERFAEAAKKASEEFACAYCKTPTIVNPVEFIEHLGGGMTYEQMLQADLGILRVCDAMYMMRGWEDSKGCIREYGFALANPHIMIFKEE